MSIFKKIFNRKKPIEDIHHIYWDMMGGFTMMKPPTEEDYKKFKNVNIADMYPDSKLCGKSVDQMIIDEFKPEEIVGEYIDNDVKVTEEIQNKLVNKKEETKMTKRQRIKQLEREVETLSVAVADLTRSNDNLHNDLFKTGNSLRNLLNMVPAATTIKGYFIYWINSETDEVWSRFVKDLICDKTYSAKRYMYTDAKIIQDTPKYFVFSAVMWEDADAHRDGKDPIYMDYYRVNKADAKSEKINIYDYKDLADKLV